MLTAKYHPFIFPSFDSSECFFQWIIHNTTQQLFNDILATNKNCWTTLNAHYFACINSLDSSVQLMLEYVYILFERQKTWALIEYAVHRKKAPPKNFQCNSTFSSSRHNCWPALLLAKMCLLHCRRYLVG